MKHHAAAQLCLQRKKKEMTDLLKEEMRMKNISKKHMERMKYVMKYMASNDNAEVAQQLALEFIYNKISI